VTPPCTDAQLPPTLENVVQGGWRLFMRQGRRPEHARGRNQALIRRSRILGLLCVCGLVVAPVTAEALEVSLGVSIRR
jgi:hypothetical protein